MSVMTLKQFNKCLRNLENPESGGQAFDALYRFLFPKIVIRVRLKFKNYSIGEDIAHEFFIKLMKSDYQEVTESLLGWTFAICDNLVMDYLRRDKRFFTLTPPPKGSEAVDAEKYLIDTEALERLRGKNETLWQIISLKYQGFSLREIAVQLNLGYAAVRKKYSRGLKEMPKKQK